MRKPTVKVASLSRARRSPSELEGGTDTDREGDLALVSRVCERDQDALATLYDRYGGACYGMARKVLGDETLAQDVVQEVFLSFWRKPTAFDASRGRFDSWLLSVAHHRAVDAVRREQQHRSRRTSVEVLDWTPDDTADVEAAAWGTLKRERVLQAVHQLPELQREAMLMAYFGGYTQRELSGLLGVPLGTVKSRMFNGTAKLRELLADVATVTEGDVL